MWKIYTIKDEHGRVKIGITVDVWRRLRRLQIGNADLLVLVRYFVGGPWATARALERAVHALLTAHRARNEWFEVDEEVAAGAIRKTAAETGIAVQEVSVAEVPVAACRPVKRAKAAQGAKPKRPRAACRRVENRTPAEGRLPAHMGAAAATERSL
jgi:hypothetical protein